MIRLYCKAHHRPENELCAACSTLVEYSNARLDKCRYGDDKPVCSRCPVHCYKSDRREQIHDVMRYAGPRMMVRHPRLALMHIVDKSRNYPKMKSEIQSGKDFSK